MRRILVLSLLLVLVSPVASAQSDNALQTWEKQLAQGAAAYDRSDFEKALEHYNAARQIRDAPRLGLQIAVIHEKLGDCTTAHVLYTDLIDRAEDEAVVADATARREGLSGCTQLEDRSIDLAAARDVTARRRTRKLVGWVLIGTGGLSILGGSLLTGELFVPAAAAACGSEDQTPNCDDLSDRYPQDNSAALRERALRVRQAHQTAGIITLSTGGVLVVTGAIILLSTSLSKTAQLHLTPRGVAISTRF